MAIQKWEYRREVYLKSHDGEWDAWLNAMGEEGWELINIYDRYYLLKRPKQ